MKMSPAISTATLHSSRENWADLAKGIAIILIVLGHVLRGLRNAGLIPENTLFLLADNFLYTIHVPTFFFLAGYFLHSSTRHGFRAYAQSKLTWIVYPYLLWSLLQGSVNVIMSAYTNNPLGWMDLIKILWNPIGQFWFLYSLFVIQILYFPLRNVRTTWLLGGALVFWLACAYVSPPNLVLSTALGAIFVILGVVAKSHNVLFQTVRQNTPLLATTFFLSIGVMLYAEFKYNSIAMLPVSVVGVLALIGGCMRLTQPRLLLLLKHIGIASMAILVMHILAASGLRIILSKVFHLEAPLAHILFGTAAGVFLPLIAYRILRYVPYSLAILGLRKN